MGRHLKKIEHQLGLDRRETGYYSTPPFVAQFICSALLELNPSAKTAFDPCIGMGELVRPLIAKGVSVSGFDVLQLPLPAEVSFQPSDFLRFYEEQLIAAAAKKKPHLPFDIFVANPPYNCHELEYIRDNKARLRAAFASVGVLNMYSMFISALIDLAPEGALLGFITLDSFLTGKGHEALRLQILQECSVHLIALCPTDLFLDQGADVRTCIVLLQKGRHFQRGVRIANRPLSSVDLERILRTKSFCSVNLESLVLSSTEDNNEFLVGVPPEVNKMFVWERLGTMFDCVTGISTGNDQRYIAPERTTGFSVPFYKNPGTRRFYTEADGYLADDFLETERLVPNFMVRNKNLLFKPGITCSSMGVPFSAAYLPPDSTFGVNANIILPESSLWWLLGYLNTHLVTFFVRGVLNRSNMITSGYVARIPVPKLTEQVRSEMADISRKAYCNRVKPQETSTAIQELNRLLHSALGLSDELSSILAEFSTNVLRAT
jgi:hypothetical protein